jgi:hypothetical protein
MPESTRPEAPDLARLVRSLALSKRFRFYLLVASGPERAEAAIAQLERDVAAAREAPVHVVRLDPYRLPGDYTGAIPWRVLAEAILAPLVEPSPALAAPDAIVLVDASAAPAADDASFRALFERLNERRDLVATALSGALVLALPARLEPLFAEAAPDFWSIRSLAVVA